MGNKITLAIILIIVCIGALVVGTTIGQSKFVDLSIYGLVIGGVLYLAFLYRYTWQIVLLLYASGIRFNYGFGLTSIYYCMLLLLIYGVLITMLRRNPYPYPKIFNQVSSGRLKIYLLLLILWGCVSFSLNKISPVPGGVQVTKGMLKAYFEAFMPSMILVLALLIPYSFRLGKSVITTVLALVLVASLVNVSHLLYLFSQGYGVSSADGYFGSEEQIGAFQIPLINASFGIYTMRNVGPLAVMISFSVLCSHEWSTNASRRVKLLAVTTMSVGLIGALMSGGRAAVALSILYVMLLAIVNRRVVMIAAAIMFAAVIVVFANLFSSFINKELPLFVARPLQYVMIEKGDAMATIESSSDVRSAAFEAGIEEWLSDPRIMLTGRSVYMSADLGEEARRLGSNEAAFVEVALKSGALHALLPSALVQYGLVGAIFYYVAYLGIFFLFFRLHRISSSIAGKKIYSVEFRSLSFIMMILTGVGIIVATIGGGWFGTLQVLMVIILKSMATRDEEKYFKNTSALS